MLHSVKLFVCVIFLFLSQAGLCQTDEYDLGPMDVVDIHVTHVDDLSKKYTVSPNGEITFSALLNTVQVSGLTAQQLDDLLTQLLAKDFLVNPEISVEVVEHHSHKVNLMGPFKSPGVYELSEKTTLMQIVLKAGGAQEVKPGQEIVVFRRGDQGTEEEAIQEIRVDMKDLMEQVNDKLNIEVKKGDVICLNDMSTGVDEKSRLLVTGMVGKPGVIDYEEGTTAIGAILAAGGFTRGAAKSRVRVIRGEGESRKIITVDVPRVTDKGDKDANVVLEPGDIVFVPETWF